MMKINRSRLVIDVKHLEQELANKLNMKWGTKINDWQVNKMRAAIPQTFRSKKFRNKERSI